MEKEKIITLIAEDIKHNQLVNGLNSIGLTDNDQYTLNIVWIVAEMMGKPKGKVPDEWLDIYHQTMLLIPHDLAPKEAQRLANNLFDALSSIEG